MSELAAAGPVTIDRRRLTELIKREHTLYRANFPGSWEAFSSSGGHLLGGVPMTWMRMWAGGFPLYMAAASGARLIDIDGNEFIDFCLGDTGAMAGHSPVAVQAAADPPVRRGRRGDHHAAHRRTRPGWRPSCPGASACRTGASR